MAGKATKSKQPGLIANLYLKSYNFFQVLGWSYILYQVSSHYLASPPPSSPLWTNVKWSVIIFQSAAILEVFHTIVGLVKSNPVLTGFQVASRLMVVYAVLLATPLTYAPSSIGLPMALFAWSVTEIIRYSYYFLNSVGFVPHFLIWARYTFFIALYPIGVTGELLCSWAAQRYASIEHDAWSYVLPNTWNFTFSYQYFMIACMLLYIPLFPQLYLHMFAQRKKVLGATVKAEKFH